MGNWPLSKFEQLLERDFPVQKWLGVKTLLAVSGGPDSVALLLAMVANLKRADNGNLENLLVGHVNHQTRLAESDADSEFVHQLADKLGIRFHESRAPAARQPRMPSEESLRNFRYDALIELANRVGARYLVMGHHQDDQVETVLFRIFRGTGIAGLAGIPGQRLAADSITLIRPLLGVSRSDIESYLDSKRQNFRVDDSNSDSRYTRNFLRYDLIPQLNIRFGESVQSSVLRLSEQATEISAYLDQMSRPLDQAIRSETERSLVLDCGAIRKHEPLLIRTWLNNTWARKDWPRQSMTADWWRTICDSICGDKDLVLNLPCSIRFEKSHSTANFLVPVVTD